jgi:restriction system protein
MPIPNYQFFLKPVLDYVCKMKRVKIANVKEHCAEVAKLTPDEKLVLLPSGKHKVYRNRIGWAITYLRKAGLITGEFGWAETTEAGINFNDSNQHITKNDLLKFESFRNFQSTITSSDSDNSLQTEKVREEQDNSP